MQVKELFPDFKRSQMGHASFEHLINVQKIIYACLVDNVNHPSAPSQEMACIFDGVKKVEILSNNTFRDYVDIVFGFAYELLEEGNLNEKKYVVFSSEQKVIMITARSIQFEENGLIM